MMARARWLAGLVVVGLAAAGGCGAASSRTSGAASAPPSATSSPARRTPLEKIQDGIPTASSPPYAYEIKQGDYASSGVIDAHHKIAEKVTIVVDTTGRPTSTAPMKVTPARRAPSARRAAM